MTAASPLHLVAPGLRMTRFCHPELPGGVGFPIIAPDGQVLTVEATERLAREPDPTVRRVRRLACILADESLPSAAAAARVGRPPNPRLRVRGLRPAEPLPLTFLASELVIGICESFAILPPGRIEGASGETLRAVVLLNNTKLASVAWGAIKAGILGGLCVAPADVVDAVRDGQEAWIYSAALTRVLLGGTAADDRCLASAKVFSSMEDA